MEALPDDILVEILVRVADVLALFRCAATCKRWRGLALAADNWPEVVRRPSSLIGFFEEQPSRGEAFVIHPLPVLSPVMPPFLPAPQSPLGPGRRFLVVSIPGSGSSMDRAAPLASCRGLVLVRLGSQEWPSMDVMVHLAVCNPLAGTSQLLPPLERKRFFNNNRCCCAILTGADYCPDGKKKKKNRSTPESLAFFKVLIIIVDWSGQYIYLRTFSFTMSGWSALRKYDNPVGWKQQAQCSGVVCRGMAHWLFRDRLLDLYILDVSAETGHVSTTKILLPSYLLGLELYDEPRLGATTDGEVSLNFLHRACLRVDIWTHQSDGDSIDGTANWLQARVIELQQPDQKRRIDDTRCMCVDERTGKFLIKDSGGNMYVADLETGTGTVEEVTAKLCDPVSTAIPLEIDWPGFFMARFAGSSKWTKTGEAILRIATRSFGEQQVT